MYHANDTLILSPSDLNGYVQCRHLTELDLALLRGEIEAPDGAVDPIADLLRAKGDEHEETYLAQLKAEGRSIIEIANPKRGLDGLRAAADATTAALHEGPDVIFQATFLQSGPPAANGASTHYRGHADFLFRVDGRPSDLGDYSYEVADTKLAKRAKPYFLLQLCFYTEMLHAVQGGEVPERMKVILGNGEIETFRTAEFAAYFRQVRRRFLSAIAEPIETYPEPCNHCQVCRWKDRCDERRADDDHLSLVAQLTSSQRKKLEVAGVKTLETLAHLDPATEITGIRPEQLEKRRLQASLQLQTRKTEKPALELLQPETPRGFFRLPEPSEGDVFFDLEGDPFYEGGLEYLWGFVTDDEEGGSEAFTVWWGRDHLEEKATFEHFIDWVVERRRRWPDAHVYHYAPYEITALKRLAGGWGSREAELDEMLREGVFVDLYRVVVEGLRIGMPSYGLKKVEAFYMEQRETEITDGNTSVVEFERWLEQGGVGGGQQAILDEIAAYNRDDCLSTLWLRNWLLEQRAACVEQHGEIEWFVPDPWQQSEEAEERDAETADLMQALAPWQDYDPAKPLAEGEDEAEYRERQARWTLAQLLEYHHREARPVWWAMFDRLGTEPALLIDDAECVSALSVDPERPPEPIKQSQLHHFRFPAQETKMRVGQKVLDAANGEAAGEIMAIDAEQGTLALKRGPSLSEKPLPEALMPGGPVQTDPQKAALRRLARDVIERGVEAGGHHYAACRDLLLRAKPRIAGRDPGSPLYDETPTVELLRELVSAMEDTYLVIQGPPGSGKTYTGARLITDLIDNGKRVGVTSTSHKAIINLLKEVDKVADEEKLSFRGLKKVGSDPGGTGYDSENFASTGSNPALDDPEVDLPAGTAWYFARDEADDTLDYLFIDEAGQVSLADALALGTAAKNIVLLGDPQQLPQVSQARHPKGCSLSALEHVLDGRQTIPPEEGAFLELTYRLHPEIAEFCSELMYEGRLGSAPGRELQRIVGAGGERLAGAGVRWAPVTHEGNSQSSVEEAEAIEEMLRGFEGASYVDAGGAEHQLTSEDVLVVTPFNAQVRCLETRLPEGTRIGTVDKFQGQEAQVVFFSLACSSGAEVPRGLEFLLSRNRLNVAISRARCLVVVVASPALLEIDCATVGQMRLVNAVCAMAEAP